MATPVSPQARLVFQEAFERLRDSVTADDARDFQSTELRDVRIAALGLEKKLAGRKALRNLGRIRPFLDALQGLSGALDVVCNGTPFAPWIWAPVKLILHLSSEFALAFEHIIAAYKQIAENLPRVDLLLKSIDKPEFQQVVAILYADILEFHRRSYKFVRRRGWVMLFSSSWGQFDRRFKGILTDLARHSHLVDSEANAFDISEASEFRKRLLEEQTIRENEKSASELKSVLFWLESADLNQEDDLDAMVSNCHPGSCDWVFQNGKVKTWRSRQRQNQVIWLNGKPGAGKSMLCSQIINSVKQDNDATVVYYLFSDEPSAQGNTNSCSALLRAIVTQLVNADRSLASLIYADCIELGQTTTIPHLRLLLPRLISTFQSVRIIVDGLDECADKDQIAVLKEMTALANCDSSVTMCKVLISSRDVNHIARILSRHAIVSLGTERSALTKAIRGFVQTRVSELVLNLEEGISSSASNELEKALLEKADGMFLWVDLVLCVLRDLYSIAAMKASIETLPKGLDEIYVRILRRLRDRLSDESYDTAIRILNWLACAKRPLKKFEIQDGICLHSENTQITDETKVSKRVFDLCKPMLEEGPNGTIRFIHSSVKQFLLKKEDPYLSMCVAHFDAAFACITYLISALALIDPMVEERRNFLDVVKGFHGLNLYAIDYWTEHVLAYLDLSQETLEHAPRLHALLASLCSKYRALEVALGQTSSSFSTQCHSAILDPRLRYLERHSDIYCLISSHVSSESVSRAMSKENSLDQEGAEMRNNASLFSRAQREYISLARMALGAVTDTDLDDATLTAFKDSFASSVFICYSHGCPRRISGFATQQELQEHQAIHIVKILCSVEGCEYGTIGFANSRALKRHHNECHRPVPAQIPRSIHRFDTDVTLVEAAFASTHSDDDTQASEDEAQTGLNDLIDENCPIDLTSLRKPMDLDPSRNDRFAFATTQWTE